jgi:hypothetical protein
VALPVAGLLAGLAGIVGLTVLGDRPLVGAESGWSIWMYGNIGAVAGTVLFAAATLVVRVFPPVAARTLLLGSSLLLLIAVPVMAGLVGDDQPLLVPLAAIGGIAFCVGWIWLGAASMGLVPGGRHAATT